MEKQQKIELATKIVELSARNVCQLAIIIYSDEEFDITSEANLSQYLFNAEKNNREIKFHITARTDTANSGYPAWFENGYENATDEEIEAFADDCIDEILSIQNLLIKFK